MFCALTSINKIGKSIWHKMWLVSSWFYFFVFFQVFLIIGVWASTFWGWKGYFARTFPNLTEKRLWDELSRNKFSVAVGTLYFRLPACYRREYWKFVTWNLILKQPNRQNVRYGAVHKWRHTILGKNLPPPRCHISSQVFKPPSNITS